MHIDEALGRVRGLSDEALLAGLSGALGSSRKWTALVLAHLAEVDDRRLHLLGGYGSLFDYCTRGLGMSEDEACRRIDVARLARRFPVLYAMLASGAVSLSVAALLKRHLSEVAHTELLAAVSGRTVAGAREVLAAWFPRADVPSSIRKLPERRATIVDADAAVELVASRAAPSVGDAAEADAARAVLECEATLPLFAPARANEAAPTAVLVTGVAAAPAAAKPSSTDNPTPPPAVPAIPARQRACSRLEPLSPGRYKITFTADAELKRQIELARDLLRHAVPSGDLATIVGRALDLLVEKTLRRRFAKTARPKAAPRPSQPSPPVSTSAAEAARAATPRDATGTAMARPCGPPGAGAEQEPTATSSPAPQASPAPLVEPTPGARPSRHVPNVVRRTVLDRDGLRCTWCGPDGVRCEARAWLEHDHIHPRGLGGTDDPLNIRHVCRAHNQYAAEQAYGQSTITRIIARRRSGQPTDVATAIPTRHPAPLSPTRGPT